MALLSGAELDRERFTGPVGLGPGRDGEGWPQRRAGEVWTG